MESQPTRIQVRGPAGLLAVVPHLLGFLIWSRLILVCDVRDVG
jgi:hypothetical protein